MELLEADLEALRKARCQSFGNMVSDQR
jgi:hypothetical protein